MRRILQLNLSTLLAFDRRAPRKKSLFDRTSSRRYSSVDSNGQQVINPNDLDLTDSILRQHNDVINLSNGQDDSTVSFNDDIDDDDDDDDSDEYGYFILYCLFSFLSLFSVCVCPSSFLLHFPCRILAVFCFAWMLLLLLLLLLILCSSFLDFQFCRQRARAKSAVDNRQSMRRSSSNTFQPILTFLKKDPDV